MKKIVLILTVAVTACSSSGPIQVGANSYMITKQSAGGVMVAPSSIKAEILNEGFIFCQKQNKKLNLTNSKELGAIPFARMPSAEIQFDCIEDTAQK